MNFIQTAGKLRHTKSIYFIQGESTGLIKIGLAGNPKERLKNLQTGSPDRLILLGTVLTGDVTEKGLHEDFKAFKAHGEWFKPSKELLDYIKQLIEANKPFFARED